MKVSQQEINSALQLHQSGNLPAARQCYRAILQKQADHYDALHMLGVLNFQEGNIDRAIILLDKAVKKRKTAEALTNLGSVLTAKGDLNRAKNAFIEAIKINPKLPVSHFNLGNSYRQLEDYDNAIAAYQSALKLKSDYYDALHNISIVYRLSGNLKEAKKTALKAIAINPNNAEIQFNLASVLSRLGEKDDAIKAYSKTIELDPNNMTARHLLSALIGETTDKPPAEYVAELFDDFADTFDDQLVNKLKYQTPQEIYHLFTNKVEQGNKYRILDLGCGTGLCGALLAEHASELIGVDLSAGMIEKAKDLNVYDALIVDDIDGYLSSVSQVFDIIISADVFVYLGALEDTFKQCKDRLKPSGKFIFSVEKHEGDDYKLLDTGRYAHSASYIRKIADKAGFVEKDFKALVLREQAGKPINGFIFVFEAVA